jgi:hypothetical protein
MGRAGEHERLDVVQPGLQQRLAFAPDRGDLVAGAAEDGQDRLADAAGVPPAERPSLDRRQLLVEEGVRVGDRLVERSREGVVKDPAPVRTGHPPHPAVDRPARSPAR